MGNYFEVLTGYHHLVSTCHEVWLAVITYLSWGPKEPSPSTGGGNELDLRCSVCPSTSAALIQCSFSYGRKAHVKKDFHTIKMNTITMATKGIKWVQQHSYLRGKNIQNVIFFCSAEKSAEFQDCWKLHLQFQVRSNPIWAQSCCFWRMEEWLPPIK